MAAFGEFKPSLNEIARLLRILVKTTCESTAPVTTSADVDTNVPAGFKSISIVATSVPITMTMSDGSEYEFTVVGETFVDAATAGGVLPAYELSGGSWKWHGIK